ncbi:hypothetical protein F0562_017260 [Nyssa sinensis]|uniref:Uncharacterized protein n=1 Tax=Nyssa sinensis TaxID=561372 RepID=A0A5J4ZHD8_9ASTE|nr:hypothetical protein F0562_017260 [Nyssa sinensis]
MMLLSLSRRRWLILCPVSLFSANNPRWYGLIYAFSALPRDLNFIQHSSHLGWKQNKRGKPIIIDPGLHSLDKSEIWWVIKQRTLPTAFKLYTDLQIHLAGEHIF